MIIILHSAFFMSFKHSRPVLFQFFQNQYSAFHKAKCRFASGVYIPDTGCYNVVGSCVFDLTSEQFTGQTLVYEGNPEQSRDVHFSKEEKYQRYLLLRDRLYQSFSDRTCGES